MKVITAQISLLAICILTWFCTHGCHNDFRNFSLLLEEEKNVIAILGEADPKCGPMVLNYICMIYGINSTIEELARLAATDETGTSMHGLAQAAEDKGLKTLALTLNFKRLKGMPKPVIAFIGKNHYVVVKSVSETVITVISNQREIMINKRDFLNIWKGEVIEIRPDDGTDLYL